MKQKNTLQAIYRLLMRSLSWNPAYLLLLIGRIGIETIQPFPAILFPALILQTLLQNTAASFRQVLLLVLLMVGSSFVVRLLDIETKRKLTLLQSSFKDYLHTELSKKQLELPLADLERVEKKELFVRADSAISGDINYAVRSLGGERGVGVGWGRGTLAGDNKHQLLPLFSLRMQSSFKM